MSKKKRPQLSLIRHRLHKTNEKVKLKLNVIDKIRQRDIYVENKEIQLKIIIKKQKELKSKNHLMLKTNGNFLFQKKKKNVEQLIKKQ